VFVRLNTPQGTMEESNSLQSVNVKDCDFASITQGSGDAILFVHGSVNDYRSWRNQMSPFAEPPILAR
jgi:hypothetical protein